MSTKWQKFDIDLDASYTAAEREAIADAVIEQIRKRTQEENKGLNGRQFAKYSPSYQKSIEFKVAGKSPGDINLTQTGNMLRAITLLSSKKGRITIGFPKGSKENAIADGNIRGTYGKASPIKDGPKRSFLGIQSKEWKKIIKDFPADNSVDRQHRQAVERVTRGASQLASEPTTINIEALFLEGEE